MEGTPKSTLDTHSHIDRPKTNNRVSHIDLGSVLHRRVEGYAYGSEPSHVTKEAIKQPITTTAAITSGSHANKRTPHVNLPNTVVIGHHHIKTKYSSPWLFYEKGYDLKLDQLIIVAAHKRPQDGKVAIRTFAGPEKHSKLEMLQRIRHERFVALLEIFDFENTFYAVFEHIVVTLAQLVSSPAYPTEQQLAAILGQILDGLTYLASEGLQHGSLTCSSVLVKPDGGIKLAGQECCSAADKSEASDVKAVGYITMELMQKYAKDDGAIGIENLNRWRMDSDAVRFLSVTTSASSVAELRRHALLDQPWRKEDLELLVDLASISVHRVYKYHP